MALVNSNYPESTLTSSITSLDSNTLLDNLCAIFCSVCHLSDLIFHKPLGLFYEVTFAHSNIVTLFAICCFLVILLCFTMIVWCVIECWINKLFFLSFFIYLFISVFLSFLQVRNTYAEVTSALPCDRATSWNFHVIPVRRTLIARSCGSLVEVGRRPGSQL